MTAKEARDKALAINKAESIQQYRDVMKSINSAINNGDYECWAYSKISQDLRTKLEMDGYTIGQTQSDRDGLATKISW